MKKWNKKYGQCLIALIAVLALFTTTAVPAFAAQKLSNKDSSSTVDGVDPDSEVGQHNSYAWYTEVFPQTDADYLWVGSGCRRPKGCGCPC